MPQNYSDALRLKAEAAGRECLKEGYQAAGWATLEAIAAALVTGGVSAGDAVAYVTTRVSVQVSTCLQREGAAIGAALEKDLKLAGSTDSHWSEWH